MQLTLDFLQCGPTVFESGDNTGKYYLIYQEEDGLWTLEVSEGAKIVYESRFAEKEKALERAEQIKNGGCKALYLPVNTENWEAWADVLGFHIYHLGKDYIVEKIIRDPNDIACIATFDTKEKAIQFIAITAKVIEILNLEL